MQIYLRLVVTGSSLHGALVRIINLNILDTLLTDSSDMTEPATLSPLWKAGHGGNYSSRINASIISLVRNDELEGIISSMRQLEASWNSKFNYPWTFFNNVPFTEEFKRRTTAETKGRCRYGKIVKSQLIFL